MKGHWAGLKYFNGFLSSHEGFHSLQKKPNDHATSSNAVALTQEGLASGTCSWGMGVVTLSCLGLTETESVT